jgi:hypothetical protein
VFPLLLIIVEVPDNLWERGVGICVKQKDSGQLICGKLSQDKKIN